MRALDTRDVRRLREITRGFGDWNGRSGTVLVELVPQFHALFGMEKSFTYQLAETDAGFSVSFVAGAGFDLPQLTTVFGHFIRNRLTGWAGFDAISPEPSQRNRVLDWRQLCTVQPSASNAGLIQLYRQLDFCEDEQLRTVVCDGASLLAWFGGFRTEPFTRRDRKMFEALVPPLQQRLRLERVLANAELSSASLGVILDNVPAAAFIVTANRAVRYTNSAGRAMLSRDRRKAFEHINQAIADTPPIGWTVLPVAALGLAAHYVIIGSDTNRDDALIKIAASRWGLTAAQTEVLRLLVRGEANKTIAAELRRSLGTIELHVTAIFRKADVDSRAALVARYWSLRFS